jgi:uncharacterized small protein (DUF1192 family)
LTLATVALVGSVALAGAQTAQDHNAHHPDTTVPEIAPAAPAPSPGGANGAMPMRGMGKMMGGDMGRVTSMMSMMHGAMMQGRDGMAMMGFDHVEGRIAFYKAELAITDAQLPQWNAFADALRGSTKGMRSAMTSMMQAGMPATAPARMDAMVQMMSARLDAMKATLAAAKPLYAVLSDDQKKAADELMAEHPMGMRTWGMGER